MNHHLHNFIWGLLFSAFHWNCVNYQHSYLFVHATCKSIPWKTISEQVKGGDGAEQNVRVARSVEKGVWEPWSDGQPLRENLCWECSWEGRAAVQMLSAPGAEPGEAPGAGTRVLLQPRTSLPASAPSDFSSSGWCAEKTPWVFQRGSGELCQPERGLGKGTMRWQCHPAVAMSPSAAELPPHRRCGSTCGEAGGAFSRAGFVKREEFILSSCQSFISQRLLHLPSASPSLPALPDVLSAGGCKIPRARAGESQHLLNLTRELRASPKPHQSDPRMRRVLIAGAEHFNSWCWFNPGFQFGVI